ncbi:metallophosphoesterase family protein [Romboutsia sp. CE17]|nr:metallophosphoesterase family protein [Romboutsia sp. CE17]
MIEVNDTRIYLIHNIKDIKCDLKGKKVNIVVYGHSHKSKINVEDDILYLNPGSIGPRRFKLGTTMMKLYIEEDIVDYDFKFERYKVKIIDMNI